MYAHLLGTVLLLLITPLVTPQAPGDVDQSCVSDAVDGITTVLLDTYNYASLLPTPWTQIGSWQETSNSSNGTCQPVIEICCAIVPSQLFTQFINTNSTQDFEVSVFVLFEVGSMCPSENQEDCSLQFTLEAFSTPVVSSNLPSETFTNVQSPVMNNSRIAVISTAAGLYLNFQADSLTCVAINRVRVLYTICPGRSSNLTIYPEGRSGQMIIGACVGNATSNMSPTAQCIYNNDFQFGSGTCQCNAGFESDDGLTQCSECPENTYKSVPGNTPCIACPVNSGNTGEDNDGCQCNPGYMRVSSSDITTGCTECTMNHYMTDGGVCMECPLGSSSNGGQVTSCMCDEQVATSQGNFTTTSLACDHCRANFYLNGFTCTTCPMRSSRNFDQVQGFCFCDNNSATSANLPNTTALSCDGCINDYFNDSGPVCSPCPSNSNSMSYNDVNCMCNVGTQLEGDGGDLTQTEPCSSCSPQFYRLSNVCTGCPNNTVRNSALDDDSRCICVNIDYKRRNEDEVEEECVVIVGFNQSEVSFTEGIHIVMLFLSVGVGHVVEVPVALMPSITPTRQAGVESNTITFSPSSASQVVNIIYEDNNVALEEDATFELTITTKINPNFVVGGETSKGMFFGSSTVTIQDDDVVIVGFSVGTISFNESALSPSITITRTNRIGSDLSLTITGGDDTLLEITNRVISFSANSLNTDNIIISFGIIDDTRNQPDRTVVLGLEYTGPFNDAVLIGGSNSNGMISIIIVDDDPIIIQEPFPVSAIIGVSAAGAGVAVLLLLIIILCLCICRLRVNRQGFYPTYEDKTSEPPTMLRYSASLRSISSQTIMPVSEGRSIQKENEFYV